MKPSGLGIEFKSCNNTARFSWLLNCRIVYIASVALSSIVPLLHHCMLNWRPIINLPYPHQFLGSVCKMPVGEDGSFAKKNMVAKKNRYKDKFPCTVYRCNASFKLLY